MDWSNFIVEIFDERLRLIHRPGAQSAVTELVYGPFTCREDADRYGERQAAALEAEMPMLRFRWKIVPLHYPDPHLRFDR